MQEDIENKTVTLVVNTSKLTARTLATAFMKFLRYSHSKIKEHHDVKPQGKQSVKELVAQNQGVEKTELADREEAKNFDRFARQYGVDYAVKKGVSPEGKPRYILFFKARDRAAIDQAMSAYSLDYMKKHQREREQSPIEQVIDPVREMLPDRAKRVRQRGVQR